MLRFSYFLSLEGVAKVVPLIIVNYLYITLTNVDFVNYLKIEAYIFLAMALILMGQDSLLVRTAVKRPEQFKETYTASILLLTAILILLVLVSFAASFTPESRLVVWLGYLTAVVFFNNTMFLAIKQNNFYLVFTIIQQILSLGFTLVAFDMHSPSVEGRLAAILYALLSCLIMQTFAIKKVGTIEFGFSKAIMLENLKSGSPLFFHSLINILRQRADKIIVAGFLSPDLAARYGLVSTYAMSLSVFYSAIFRFMVVRFYEQLREKTRTPIEHYQKRMTVYNGVFLLAAMFIAFCITEALAVDDTFVLPLLISLASYLLFPAYLLYLNAAIYEEKLSQITIIGLVSAIISLGAFLVACLYVSYSENFLYSIPLIYCAIAIFFYRSRFTAS